MTIIHANHYLNQLLAPAELERIARLCTFCLRLCVFGGGKVDPIALRIGQQVKAVAQEAFKQVLLRDRMAPLFAVHKSLATVFPGRFKTISPAAIECHMTMSLLEQKPLCMQLSADTASERQFLPDAHSSSGTALGS